MMARLYWKCGCGKLQLELDADPFNVSACHCHSCVASSKYLDDKYKDEPNYSSGITNGAAAGAFFMPDALKTAPGGELIIGCLKVGPKGKSIRKYAKCCGTQLGVVEKAFIVLGLNSLYTNQECTDKYVPREPVVNILKKYAFDPEKVPEPSYSIAPLGRTLKFLSVLITPFGPSTEKEILDKFLVDPAEAEEVPITWE